MDGQTYHQVLAQLKLLLPTLTHNTSLDLAPAGANYCQRATGRLVELWRDKGFESPGERLAFYQDILPFVLGYWRYYHMVYEVEILRPLGPTRRLLAYYTTKLRMVEKELHAATPVARLLRLIPEGQEGCFFQPAPDQQWLPSPFMLTEPALYHPHSAAVASHLAAAKTAEYLQQRVRLADLETGPGSSAVRLKWTGSKVALAELIYALQEAAVFDGRPDISAVAVYLGEVFGVSMENIYKMYENMRIRKKNRTPFMDTLRMSLERRMDSDDLHAL